MKSLAQHPAIQAIALAARVLPGAAMPARTNAQTPPPEEGQVIAREAAIYDFPLVDNYRVLHACFVDRSSASSAEVLP
ncbi:hypothetical protein [Variovorax rhizosphaerae]|uniref:Uncharacterized protein n=1 Tax=Variovorax rhizosphaerae TaxID=1836200 RepID=A0ABU8WJ05_9BURK